MRKRFRIRSGRKLDKMNLTYLPIGIGERRNDRIAPLFCLEESILFKNQID